MFPMRRQGHSIPVRWHRYGFWFWLTVFYAAVLLSLWVWWTVALSIIKLNGA